MPKRTDIKKILIVGAGPIVIGQACEFDYSGVQACKSLRDEGYEVVLLNSNPATIMTDPEMAERTYIEPITLEILDRILEKEKPDAILPTLGGQTALNLATEAWEQGILQKHDVEMIGATSEVIHRAEDRDEFKRIVTREGIDVLHSELARDMDEAREILKDIGLPVVIRASFTLGGTGGSVAYNIEDFERLCKGGLEISPVHTVLLEECAIGWKEYELEVMRDNMDNSVIICSIENLDPMGVHTGDSITVAPIQTLTDREYQDMRDEALTIVKAIGVETGGCNIQFATHPETGRRVAIEMNPRVSRSSALASKATGFPIAKIAAKVAVGMTLDEISNDITRETPACFEPTIDYCVVKIPRFTFEKFPASDPTLTVSMKSVGEVMSIGRTFKESMQKALRGMETKRAGLGCDGRDHDIDKIDTDTLREMLTVPNAERIYWLRYAFVKGWSVEDVFEATKIDRWFLDNIKQIVEREQELGKMETLSDEDLFEAKRMGFSDIQLGELFGKKDSEIRQQRIDSGVRAVYKQVDTCGGEFEAYTPYFYSTYEKADESSSKGDGVMILGGGPNRIGQGLEFDYCCVHAAEALGDAKIDSIMVNCNPETVSTDYDTSDRLYFEPLTLEDVLEIVNREKPKGLIVQFGGQTPLNLATGLKECGVPILGTSPDAIDRAEDREQFAEMVQKLNLRQPENGMADNVEEALQIADEIGYPVIVRPSFVLGGRAMEIVYTPDDLKHFTQMALETSDGAAVLIDRFLEDAIELDVDAVADGKDVYIAGMMEHIEYAGCHSGDAAMVLPPQLLPQEVLDEIAEATRHLAIELDVRGLMNVQFAVINNKDVYILEVNPRASRTVPFVSKVTGVPIAKVATQIMLGKTLEEMGLNKPLPPINHMGVKESVFPFNRFPGVDAILGPEMKSTGEVMGIDSDFALAYAKSQQAAGTILPTAGTVFLSVKDDDKDIILPAAKKLADLGFKIIATGGTSKMLTANGVANKTINKVMQGQPHIVDAIKNGDVDLIINTPSGRRPRADEQAIRINAISHGISLITTATAAVACVDSIEKLSKEKLDVKTIQDYIGDRINAVKM